MNINILCHEKAFCQQQRHRLSPFIYTPETKAAIENVNDISTNVDQESLETEFSIAICRLTGDKWQSKTLFLAILDPRSSIVKSVFDCHLSGMI